MNQFAGGRELASRSPQARLVALGSDNHITLGDEPGGRRGPQRSPGRDCTTVALVQENVSHVDAPLEVADRHVKVAYSSGEHDGVGRLQVIQAVGALHAEIRSAAADSVTAVCSVCRRRALRLLDGGV